MDETKSLEKQLEDLNLNTPAIDPYEFFEDRPTQFAGIGSFAIKAIPAGTRILCEPPLFVLPDDADILQIYRAITNRSVEDQMPFWALSQNVAKFKETDWIATLRANYSGDDAAFEDLVEAHESALAIYETNRFTVRTSSGSDHNMGMFPNAARLNHSCQPNVFHRFNTHLGRLTIHTLRDVHPGEELLTSYIDICAPTTERRRVLRHWGFKCLCVLCRAKTPARELRRKKLSELLGKVKRAEARRTEEVWQQWDFARALSVVEEVIQLMEEEGLEESDTLGEAYGIAADYAVEIGWHEQAIGWAEKALSIERKCCGEDSPEVDKARLLLEYARKDLELGKPKPILVA